MAATFGVDPPPSSLDMTSALVTPDHNQRSLVKLSPNSWPTETVCCFKSLEEVRQGPVPYCWLSLMVSKIKRHGVSYGNVAVIGNESR